MVLGREHGDAKDGMAYGEIMCEATTKGAKKKKGGEKTGKGFTGRV